MKIFISIASYQDLLLPITINSAYTNAKFKENLRFGIIDQCKVKLDFSKAKLKDQMGWKRYKRKGSIYFKKRR